MAVRSLKSLLVAVFSAVILLFSNVTVAQEEHGTAEHEAEAHGKKEKKGGFNASEVIFGHVLDAHEFHFLEYEGSDGKEHAVSIPLPVILYSPAKRLFNVYVFRISSWRA